MKGLRANEELSEMIRGDIESSEDRRADSRMA